MAEILALGLSHYPPLLWPDENMAGILKKMLTNPELPETQRDPANWPQGMRDEWGDDEGETSAARHRDEMVNHLRAVRAALDEFDPDFVLMWGDDQYENFREDGIPPYCVNAHPEFRFHNFPNNIWGETREKEFVIPGVPKAGKDLASHLIRSGFDTAYSYKPLHHPLGHAFTNAIFYLDYDRKGFDYPILPISVNCYGRHVISQRGGLPDFSNPLSEDDLDPPAPQPWRLFDLGGEIARYLAKSEYRVAILASSGWSHAFLTPKTNFLTPDSAADRKLFDALKTGDYDTWRNYPGDAIEESGQQEVLNWMCLVGALNALDRKADYCEFVDTYIFNSTKSFLIAEA